MPLDVLNIDIDGDLSSWAGFKQCIFFPEEISTSYFSEIYSGRKTFIFEAVLLNFYFNK